MNFFGPSIIEMLADELGKTKKVGRISAAIDYKDLKPKLKKRKQTKKKK